VNRQLLGLALGLTAATAAIAQPSSDFLAVLPVVPSGLSVPVGVVSAGNGSGRLFLVEQSGKIKIFDGASVLATPFLDLGAGGLNLISSCVGGCGERGLLGLAFDPNYVSNDFFYVYYTRLSDGDIVVARYEVSADPDVADTASAQQILRIEHSSQGNHNGGSLAFGPDGLLYLGTGDGGGGGDPDENGQDLLSLLGKILRLDVASDGFPADAERFYAIPPTNPFVGGGAEDDEIWAYGLRNPWRLGFDRLTGALFIGDVGQGAWEEIDHQMANGAGGINYGWDCREGAHDYPDPNGDFNVDCAAVESVDPILEYGHSENGVFIGCSVTGGFPYRGGSSAAIYGHYLFADYCTGRIFRGIPGGGGTWTRQELFDTPYNITSFGEDPSGKLFFTHHGGALYRIAPYSFSDVLPDTKPWAPIESVFLAGVSLGCGGGRYCSDDPVQRQQIAALLLRAQDPQTAPTACSSDPFTDVAMGSEYCRWIKALTDQDIAESCNGGGRFCPTQPVTRGALSPLLLKAVNGGSYSPTPAACTSDLYDDVPKSDDLCPWIRDAVEQGLVPACDEANNTFCRYAPVRRDQLSGLLVNAFSATIPEQTP
jgi:glucose/arabinose dehydrogenase